MKYNDYWFRPKTYGWGFVPSSWEGWLITLVLIGVVFGLAWSHGFFDTKDPAPTVVFDFLFQLAVTATLFGLIAVRRMKEPLGWRWGTPTKKKASFSAFLNKLQK